MEKEDHYSNRVQLHKRKLLQYKGDYVRDPDLFLNQEHRLLFKQFYPHVFHWFFEKNVLGLTKKTNVVNELNAMEDDPRYNHLFTSLAQHFKWQHETITIDNLAAPQGVAMEEQLTLSKPLVTDRLSYLQHSLRSIVFYYYSHHTEKNDSSNLVAEILLTKVKISSNMDEKDAISMLEVAIERAKSTFKNKDNFIFRQLSILSPSDERFAKQVLDVLSNHLVNNKMLSPSQTAELAKSIALITQIENDRYKNGLEKYKAIRNEVIRLIPHAYPKDDGPEMENKPQKADALYVSLNQLSHAHYGEIDFGDKIILKLDNYLKRNSFWNRVNKILDFFYLPPLFVYSEEKEIIAETLRSNLQELKEQGKSNDIYAIDAELNKTSKALIELQKDSLKTGLLEKIISGVAAEIHVGVFSRIESEHETYLYQLGA
ncbi:MAG: DUF5621 domain-containing protein [Silvanigrellaceae bacterium]|nr:DUF5621 domain-containing protein [Silvanigrellaceae bacterium]